MPFVERWKSFFEQQLDGWAPDELVSIAAELAVAACIVAPLIALGALGRWLVRKNVVFHWTAASKPKLFADGQSLTTTHAETPAGLNPGHPHSSAA